MTTQDTIGKLIDDTEQRDAIHIAVAPMVAGYVLNPGERIGIGFDGKAVRFGVEFIGIVDPFLTKPVQLDQRFWMFLLPNTITSLRHAWTHPAFAEEPEAKIGNKQLAEAWLSQFARHGRTSYEYLVECAANGKDMCFGTEMYDFNDDTAMQKEFWDNLEIVTGKRMTADQRGTTYFRCAC